jgi:nitroreductase
MNIIESLQWRYATKKFDASKVLSEEKLDIIKQAFNLTATSFGLQTIKMMIVENKTMRADLLAHAFYQKQVVDASHLLVLCIQENIEEEDVDLHFNNVNYLRETPETILKPYRADLKKFMTNMSVDERQEWSVKQAYIALGNLMTVCAVEGIDSCPMEGFIPKKFDEVLNLEPKGLKSVLLLPIGFRAEDDQFATMKKVRKSEDHTIIEL